MPSPTDELFAEIFGVETTKAGEAFERLSAIAAFLIGGGDIEHDARLRGAFSQTLHQIDVLQRGTGGTSIGEAKDYAIGDSKVGRGDLQKLVGTFPDLPDINSAKFFSATGYTGPAIKYGHAAEPMIGVPLELYTLRPAVETDEAGLVKTIVVRATVHMPDTANARFTPIITLDGKRALLASLPPGESKLEIAQAIGQFFDKEGNSGYSVVEMTSQGYGTKHDQTGQSHLCFWLPGRFIKVNDILAELHGIEVEMPIRTMTREIVITDDSTRRLTLLDENGVVQRLITDQQLRGFSFNNDGRLIPPPSLATWRQGSSDNQLDDHAGTQKPAVE